MDVVFCGDCFYPGCEVRKVERCEYNIHGNIVSKDVVEKRVLCPVCGSDNIVKVELPDLNEGDPKKIILFALIGGLVGAVKIPADVLERFEMRIDLFRVESRKLKKIDVCKHCLSPKLFKIKNTTICKTCFGCGSTKLKIDEKLLDFLIKLKVTKLKNVYPYLKELGLAMLVEDELLIEKPKQIKKSVFKILNK